MNAPSIAAKKPRGRPFPKGHSGNPAGKPKGTRHAATLAAEMLLDGESEALTRKVIALAHAGDRAALRLCLDRIVPPRRERPLFFDLPPLKTMADALAAMQRIGEGVAQGELSESEVKTLGSLVDSFITGCGQFEYETRLAGLEKEIAGIKTIFTEMTP